MLATIHHRFRIPTRRIIRLNMAVVTQAVAEPQGVTKAPPIAIIHMTPAASIPGLTSLRHHFSVDAKHDPQGQAHQQDNYQRSKHQRGHVVALCRRAVQALFAGEPRIQHCYLPYDLPWAAARKVIGSGKADYSVNGIYSQDLASVHMDSNLNVTRMGAADAGEGRVQTGASVSLSLPLDEHWGVTGELSGTRRSGADSTAQVLFATTYSPTKQLAIDFGFARGLNRASPKWSFFSGFVMPLARLW